MSGNYSFVVLALGTANSVAEFVSRVQTVIGPLDHSVCAYIDDIIVFTLDQESHLEILKHMFDQLRKFKLKVRKEKCQFMLDEVKYLGYIVNAEGISISSDRIAAIRQTSRPTTSSEVRFLLGLLMLRWLIPNLAEACHGHAQVSGKDFCWSSEQETSWNDNVALLDQPLKNYHLDPTKELVLYTDASGHAIGAVLTQGEDLVYAVSGNLLRYQEAEVISHRALLTLKTVHKPLLWLIKKNEVDNARLTRVLCRLWDFDFKAENIQEEEECLG